MILVQLPADILGVADTAATLAYQMTYDHAELIQNKLLHNYQIEASNV